MRRITQIASLFLLVVSTNVGITQISFHKSFPPFQGEFAFQTADAGFILTGFSYELTFFKVDSLGNFLWGKNIPGYFSLGGIETDNDDLIIVGANNSNGNGFVVKSNANGELAWIKIVKSINFSPSYGPSEIIKTSDGNYLIYWIRVNNGESSDVYLIKMNENGDFLWTKKYENFAGNRSNVIQTKDKGFLFAAGHNILDTLAGGGLIGKVDSNGNPLWSRVIHKNIGLGAATAIGVAETPDGGCLLVGSGLYRLDNLGNAVWGKGLPGSGRDIFPTHDGNYFVLSYHGGTQNSYHIMKTDADGNVFWSKFLPPHLYSVRPADDGGAILCGYQNYPEMNGYLLKTKVNSNDEAVGCSLTNFSINSLTDQSFNSYAKPFENVDVTLQYDSLEAWNDVAFEDSTICFIQMVDTENPMAKAQNIHLYPNPFSNSVSIELPQLSSKILQLVIFDLLGREVKTFRSEENKNIDWDGKNNFGIEVESGIYILRVEFLNGRIISKKIAKFD